MQDQPAIFLDQKNEQIASISISKGHETSCRTFNADSSSIWLRQRGQGSTFGEVPALVTQVRESDALHAERDGEFSAMMEIVGDDVPDNPLASERVGVKALRHFRCRRTL